MLAWDDLRIFLAVARTGSLNAASKLLGVNHTTVGRHISALESRLGTELIKRGTGAELTAAGKSAMEDAIMMEEIANSIARKAKAAENALEGEVRFALTEGVSSFWLFPSLKPFQEAHPSLKISWNIGDHLEPDLGGTVDLAWVWRRPQSERVVARKLGAVTFQLFAPPSYDAEFGFPTSREDLSRHRFLHFDSHAINPELHAWNAFVSSVPPAMQLSNPAVTVNAMTTYRLLALLPSYATLIDPSLVPVPLELGIALEVWLAYHEDQRKDARIRAIVDEVASLYARDRDTWFR